MKNEHTRWVKGYETFLRLLIQTAAAGLGLWIMFKAINGHVDRPWLYAAAIGMMGIPFAQSFEALVGFIGRVSEAVKETSDAADKPEDKHEQK